MTARQDRYGYYKVAVKNEKGKLIAVRDADTETEAAAWVTRVEAEGKGHTAVATFIPPKGVTCPAPASST